MPVRHQLQVISDLASAWLRSCDLSQIDLNRIIELCNDSAADQNPDQSLLMLLQEAMDLLSGAYEPDRGQLRTQWDHDVEKWVDKARRALETT